MLALLLAVSVAPVQVSAPTEAAGAVATHIIFLDRERAMLRPGLTDSRRGTSDLVGGPLALPGWDIDDATWTQTVACVRAMWSPFAMDVTDEDPGVGVPHVQVVFGGEPADLGMPPATAGVSPMRTDCGVIESSVVFAFPQLVGDRADLVCEIVSQEIGHSFGLDHELDAGDPMSYLPRTGPRTFQDHAVSCGETTGRPCGGSTPACRADQDSYAILLDRLGPAVPSLPEDGDGGYGEPAGCAVGGGSAGGGAVLLLALALVTAKFSRRRA